MYCSYCGAQNEDTATVCKTCGRHLKKLELAGFWRRYGALALDYVILYIIMIIVMVISVVIGILVSGPSTSTSSTMSYLSAAIMFLGFVVTVIIGILYFTIFEMSRWQGTPGKMAVGLAVVDLKGNRIGFGKALIRNLAKIISVLILGIGFYMAGFTAKKQGLHDLIAGTTVITKQPLYLEVEPEPVKASPELKQ